LLYILYNYFYKKSKKKIALEKAIFKSIKFYFFVKNWRPHSTIRATAKNRVEDQEL
jgi:uncharacterized membrane protein